MKSVDELKLMAQGLRDAVSRVNGLADRLGVEGVSVSYEKINVSRIGFRAQVQGLEVNIDYPL